MSGVERTRLFQEAAEAPQIIHTQLQTNRRNVERVGAALRELAPRAVVTCARGSSDHAATFARYLLETRAGLLTSSAAPSVSSVYATKPNWDGIAFIAISQSGASPDLMATVAAAKAAGACVIACVNAEESPFGACRASCRSALRRRGSQRRGHEITSGVPFGHSAARG